MKAVGAYIKGAREGLGLNNAQVAARMTEFLGESIDPTTVWRVERGKMKPRFDLFIAMLTAVQGQIEDVLDLMRQSSATTEDGEARGRRAVGAPPAVLSEEEAEFNRAAAAATPEQRARALVELRRQFQGS